MLQACQHPLLHSDSRPLAIFKLAGAGHCSTPEHDARKLVSDGCADREPTAAWGGPGGGSGDGADHMAGCWSVEYRRSPVCCCLIWTCCPAPTGPARRASLPGQTPARQDTSHLRLHLSHPHCAVQVFGLPIDGPGEEHTLSVHASTNMATPVRSSRMRRCNICSENTQAPS